MDRSRLLARTQGRGVNRVVYWVARAILQPFFLVYFRMKRIGMEHVPKDGPVIIASNHRSFMDPWVIGMLLRRPVFYVAKTELFHNRLVAWLLSSLGAFPVDRGNGDRDAMGAARLILERGDVVVIFPEGTRIRPGALAQPKRGAGRLALETGAPVVPVALIGTEAVRRGWRIRPHKVRIRAGRPLRFPHVDEPSPALARAVTERIWPCVELQWEWLGGTPALRRAAIVGAGSWGTGLAVAFARAGLEVELGCRTEQQAAALERSRVNQHYLPGVRLPDTVRVTKASRLALDRADVVCFAVPAAALPAAVGAHAEAIHDGTGVVVLCKGLIAPNGMLPSAYVAERANARAVACVGGPGHAADALSCGASLVIGCKDPIFAAQIARTRRPTSPGSSSRAPRRTPPRWPPPSPGSAGPTPRAPRRAGSSPRSTRSRAVAAGTRRRSPAWPARGTSSRPSSPRAAATGVPASCSARACLPRRSATSSGSPARRSTASACWPRRCAARAFPRRRSTASPRSSTGASTPTRSRPA
jgi:1-acyl-sn-glycerol-3-phosphate acyltransferase